MRCSWRSSGEGQRWYPILGQQNGTRHGPPLFLDHSVPGTRRNAVLMAFIRGRSALVSHFGSAKWDQTRPSSFFCSTLYQALAGMRCSWRSSGESQRWYPILGQQNGTRHGPPLFLDHSVLQQVPGTRRNAVLMAFIVDVVVGKKEGKKKNFTLRQNSTTTHVTM